MDGIEARALVRTAKRALEAYGLQVPHQGRRRMPGQQRRWPRGAVRKPAPGWVGRRPAEAAREQ